MAMTKNISKKKSNKLFGIILCNNFFEKLKERV
jgi:hypothetical protein